MFKKNKYYSWYSSIINSAKSRVVDGYVEEHHIVPKSLGGSNSIDNLVKLTAREHFICHWLLTKCVEKHVEKMKYALWLMATTENSLQERYKITPKKYEIIKQSLASTFSKQHTGRKMTEETKRKISETRKEKFASGELEIKVYDSTREKLSKMKIGIKRSRETKEKIGKAHSNKTISEEHKEILRKKNTGKVMSEETKRKISETRKRVFAERNKNGI